MRGNELERCLRNAFPDPVSMASDLLIGPALANVGLGEITGSDSSGTDEMSTDEENWRPPPRSTDFDCKKACFQLYATTSVSMQYEVTFKCSTSTDPLLCCLEIKSFFWSCCCSVNIIGYSSSLMEASFLRSLTYPSLGSAERLSSDQRRLSLALLHLAPDPAGAADAGR